MFVALLCCTLSGFAEEKPIKIEVVKRPQGRSEVLLPTASIDGQVLTISFVSSATFEISVVDASGTIVYTGTYSGQSAVITLPNLPAGGYELEIEQGSYVYTGDFEIAN